METQKTVRELIKRLTGQANTLTVQRLFIDYTGDHISALLLSQILYWSERTRDGWFYKKAIEWQEELGISKKQLNRAERILDEKGIERQLKKVGTAPIQHYRIADNFHDLIITFCDSDQRGKSPKGKIAKGNARKLPKGKIQESAERELSSIEAEITIRLPQEITNMSPDDDYSPAQQIFLHWQTVMTTPKSKFTPDRQKKVKARLNEGYTIDELKEAIDGCRLTPFNMGENQQGQIYNDLELICRDGVHVERFRNNKSLPPKPNGNGHGFYQQSQESVWQGGGR